MLGREECPLGPLPVGVASYSIKLARVSNQSQTGNRREPASDGAALGAKLSAILSGRVSLQRSVVVSFARHGRSRPQSFPRKRESTSQTFGNALATDWIPAFAGMTGVSEGMIFQMTPLPGAHKSLQFPWFRIDCNCSGSSMSEN